MSSGYTPVAGVDYDREEPAALPPPVLGPVAFPDPESNPLFRAVVYIEVTFRDDATGRLSEGQASGVLVGRNDILTATHVVSEPGSTLVGIEIYPAYDFGPSGRDAMFAAGTILDDFFQPRTIDGPQWNEHHFNIVQTLMPDGRWGMDRLSSASDLALIGVSSELGLLQGMVPMAITPEGWSGTVTVLGYPGRENGNFTYSSGPASLIYPSSSGGGFLDGFQAASPRPPVIDISSTYGSPGSSGGPILDSAGYVIGVVSTGVDFIDASGTRLFRNVSGARIDTEWASLQTWMAGNDGLLDSAPRITSDGGGETAAVALVENGSLVTVVSAANPNPNSALSYGIVGGADAAQFRIDPSSGLLSFVAAPDFEAPVDADGDNSYVVRVRAFGDRHFDDQTITVRVTDISEPAGPVAPLGGVLWRHADGSVATAAHDLGDVPVNWRIATSGDFDGDRDSDILWRHRDGMVVLWEMEGGQYLVNHNIAFASTGWDIVDAGDFDADGDADVLWRHRDGAVVTWEMQDGQYVQNHNIAFASTGWSIQALGDFDADGDSDVIWRHRDGAVVTWEMEDGTYVRNHNIAFASTSWRIDGTGDFDADGDSDILWRHADGDVVTWEMQDAEYLTTHHLPHEDAAWQITGIQDFDRDGDSDILWRNSHGTVATWEVEGGAYLAHHVLGVVAHAWQIERTGAFDLG